MTIDRPALVWGLVAGQAARRRGQVVAADVCAAAVEALPVSGVWVMARGATGPGHVMCVTDEVGEQLAELQMTRPSPEPRAMKPVPLPSRPASLVGGHWPSQEVSKWTGIS